MGGLVAIHDGHPHVHPDEFGLPLLPNGNRFLPIDRRANIKPNGTENLLKQLATFPAIFNDQDAARGFAGGEADNLAVRSRR